MRLLAFCLGLSILGSQALCEPAALAQASKKTSSASSSKKTSAPKKKRAAPKKKRPAKKASKPKTPAPKPPPSKLPGPIEIAKVHVEVGGDRVLVTSDIAFDKGEWEGGDLRAHVAYGAPGVPLAFEAHLCAPDDGDDEAECSPLPHEIARTAPSDAAFVIGPRKMAGQTIELEEKKLAALFAQHPRAILRLRQLRPMPIASATGHREILIRLGELRGAPHSLGGIEIESNGELAIAEADARLCGMDVEPTEIAVVRKGAVMQGVPPRLVHRSGHEDLCLRFRLVPQLGGSGQ